MRENLLSGLLKVRHVCDEVREVVACGSECQTSHPLPQFRSYSSPAATLSDRWTRLLSLSGLLVIVRVKVKPCFHRPPHFTHPIFHCVAVAKVAPMRCLIEAEWNRSECPHTCHTESCLQNTQEKFRERVCENYNLIILHFITVKYTFEMETSNFIVWFTAAWIEVFDAKRIYVHFYTLVGNKEKVNTLWRICGRMLSRHVIWFASWKVKVKLSL
jgi:hypothetical protein